MTAYDDAQATQQQTKQDALAAIAQYGSQGQAAYDAANQRIQDTQNAALSNIAGMAVGAPSGAGNELAAIVRMPGDYARQNIDQARAALADDLARKGASASTYFDQAAASVPALQAWTQGQIATRAAAAGGKAGKGGAGGGGKYGGYSSEGQYENAVMALARDAAQQAAGQAQGRHDAVIEQQQQDPEYQQYSQQVEQQGARRRILDYERSQTQQQAKNERGDVNRVRGLEQSTPGTFDDYAARMAEQEAQARAAAEQEAQMNDLRRGLAARQDITGKVGMASDAKYRPQWEQALAERRQVEDPLNLYEFARSAAINDLGADPLDAIGRFDQNWALKLGMQDVKGPNDYVQQQNEYEQRQRNGGYTDNELASMQPNTTEQRKAVQQSPEYQSAAAEALGMLQEATKTGTGSPATEDDLKAFLLQAGYPPEVTRQVLSDYGMMFPSSTYYQRTPTGP